MSRTRCVRRAWRFLHPYVSQAHACIFSREQYVWDGRRPRHGDDRPALDRSVLAQEPGARPRGGGGDPRRGRGRSRRPRRTLGVQAKRRHAGAGRSPRRDDPGSRRCRPARRWSRRSRAGTALKDPIGLIDCFTEHVLDPAAHLLLAGPDVKAVADDPEGAEVLEQVIARRAALDPEARARVHLAMLPLDDIEENAAIVNAVQRRSQVVVQKSIAEGFGLTVSEAMWKGTPVVASRVGGIQDQIVDGESGADARAARPARLRRRDHGAARRSGTRRAPRPSPAARGWRRSSSSPGACSPTSRCSSACSRAEASGRRAASRDLVAPFALPLPAAAHNRGTHSQPGFGLDDQQTSKDRDDGHGGRPWRPRRRGPRLQSRYSFHGRPPASAPATGAARPIVTSASGASSLPVSGSAPAGARGRLPGGRQPPPPDRDPCQRRRVVRRRGERRLRSPA